MSPDVICLWASLLYLNKILKIFIKRPIYLGERDVFWNHPNKVHMGASVCGFLEGTGPGHWKTSLLGWWGLQVFLEAKLMLFSHPFCLWSHVPPLLWTMGSLTGLYELVFHYYNRRPETINFREKKGCLSRFCLCRKGLCGLMGLTTPIHGQLGTRRPSRLVQWNKPLTL